MLLQVNTAHAAARRTLLNCLAPGNRQFHNLFSGALHPLKDFRGDISPLIELGLLKASSGEALALTPVVAFDGLFLKCDSPALELWERVFPIHDDESLLLARWAEAKKGERVLDLGTGAGVSALKLAAQGADKVVATDINPRVGDYFMFNAELNGLTDKVEYVHSDAFTGIDTEQFNVIVCNPPFVPVPPETHYFLHSDGGLLGTSVLERLATGWKNHVCPGGRLYAMALSLGSASEWRISSLFPEAQLGPIYKAPHIVLDRYLAKFQWVTGLKRWQNTLAEMRYDRIGYFGFTAGRDVEVNLSRLNAVIVASQTDIGSTPWNDHSWSMSARLKRYSPAPPHL